MFKVDGEEYLSADEIAQEIGTSYRTVVSAINELAIPFIRNPRDRREQGYPRNRVPDIREHILKPQVR